MENQNFQIGSYVVSATRKKSLFLRPQIWACSELIHNFESSLKNFESFKIIHKVQVIGRQTKA